MTEHGFYDVRWRIRDIVLGSVVAIIFTSVALFLIGLVVAMTGRQDLGPVEVLAAAASEVLILYVVWRLAVKRYASGGWAAIGVRAPMSVAALLLIPVILLASLGFTALYELAVKSIGVEALVPEHLPSEMFGEGMLRVLTIVVVAVLIPFVEETFFRGFLFAGLAARFGVLTGLIVSAAVFSVAHADVKVFIPIFVAGLLFGWAYHKTKTLWVPIAAHACQNLAAVMFLDFV